MKTNKIDEIARSHADDKLITTTSGTTRYNTLAEVEPRELEVEQQPSFRVQLQEEKPSFRVNNAKSSPEREREKAIRQALNKQDKAEDSSERKREKAIRQAFNERDSPQDNAQNKAPAATQATSRQKKSVAKKILQLFTFFRKKDRSRSRNDASGPRLQRGNH